jgi:hypothetical protein
MINETYRCIHFTFFLYNNTKNYLYILLLLLLLLFSVETNFKVK